MMIAGTTAEQGTPVGIVYANITLTSPRERLLRGHGHGPLVRDHRKFPGKFRPPPCTKPRGPNEYAHPQPCRA
jgi:hypothetical protein